MREWKRVSVPTLCGACGAIVREGATVQILTLADVKRRLTRCQDCAEGTCPPVLPAGSVVTKAELAGRVQAIAAIAAQWVRPEKRPVVVAPKQRAYRGGTVPVQPGMLENLPLRTRR